MTEYIAEITEQLARTADEEARKNQASAEQMLVCSVVFLAHVIHANYGDNPALENQMIDYCSVSIRHFVSDIISKETPAG